MSTGNEDHLNTSPLSSSKAGGTGISGVHLWLILHRAARAVGQHAQQHIQQLDMCPSDFGVLELLLHKGPMPVNTLGSRVMLTSGSSTAAVDRLEQRNLVTRSADPRDGRSRIVTLTAQGRALITAAFDEHVRAMDHATGSLTPEEKAQLADLLRKLGHAAAASLGSSYDSDVSPCASTAHPLPAQP